MSEVTKIEWADHTWNPWRGCTKVSPGCLNCYAETLSRRNPAVLGQWGKGAPRVLAKNWNDPVRWDRTQAERSCGYCEFDEAEGFLVEQCVSCRVRPSVFPSLCDWLDDEVPIAWLGRFLHLIHETPNLDWLLLTKRPEQFRARMTALGESELPWSVLARRWISGSYPLNVWFGVSVEDQPRTDERVPLLLDIPALVRWLSVEPLIGPVDLTRMDGDQSDSDLCMVNCLTGLQTDMGRPCPGVPRINWVVVGGESGPGARPCRVEWIRSIVRECQSACVPVFVKQLGANPHCECGELPANGQTGWHPKGGDPAEWPQDLRVRQYPEVQP